MVRKILISEVPPDDQCAICAAVFGPENERLNARSLAVRQGLSSALAGGELVICALFRRDRIVTELLFHKRSWQDLRMRASVS